GMLIGLITYLAGGRYLPKSNAISVETSGTAERGPAPLATYILLLSVIAIVVVFRASYEQSGNTVALWADSGVDRHVGSHFSIPMTWFQSLNPMIIFMFTPIIVLYWQRAARRGREPGSISKMSLGAFIVGASYLLLAAVAQSAGGERASWLWLAFYFLIYTIGELFILPVGLGLFGRLAPPAFAATAIAAWFMASFFGNLAAGVLGALWSSVSQAAFFAITGGVGILSGLLLLVLSPWAKRVEAASMSAAATEAELNTAALAADSRH
ncbi:MAG TPA: hypothetical protein VGG69_12450, partial [Rhizomicrobium sp.]